jgi:hypothetical protein
MSNDSNDSLGPVSLYRSLQYWQHLNKQTTKLFTETVDQAAKVENAYLALYAYTRELERIRNATSDGERNYHEEQLDQLCLKGVAEHYRKLAYGEETVEKDSYAVLNDAAYFRIRTEHHRILIRLREIFKLSATSTMDDVLTVAKQTQLAYERANKLIVSELVDGNL